MKKILLFLYVFFCVLFIHAQIVVTNDDIAGPGATIIQALDESPGPSIVPGPAGANQTWNLNALKADELDTMMFVNPDWTPYAALFPQANFAMRQLEDVAYMMFYRDVNTFGMIGMIGEFGADTLIVMRIDPPQVIADFPVAYLNTRTDTAVFIMKMPGPSPGSDSIMMKMTIGSQVVVDGWGSITIPMGTFDALRLYEVRTQIDSVFTLIFGQWIFFQETIMVTDIYTWWTNDAGAGIFLAEMTIEPTEAGSETKVLYLKQSPTYGIEDQLASNSAMAFPNPATSYIIIKTGLDFHGTIEVLDILGNIHSTDKNVRSGNHRVELKTTHSGLYLYRLTDIKSGHIQTGRFIIL